MTKHRFECKILLVLVAALLSTAFSASLFAADAIPVLKNPGFELPLIAENGLAYGGGADWSWTGFASLNNGAPYGTGASSQGYQYAALQGAGDGSTVSSVAQTMTGLTVGTTYTLSFQSAAIEGFSGVNPFSVSVDGTPLSFGGNTVLSPSTTYTTYTTTFTATSSTATLQFNDYVPPTALYVSYLDDIRVSFANPGQNLVVNGSFETPAYSDGAHNISPTGTGWIFSDAGNGTGAGIDCGNPYTANNSSAFEGSQQAFLQGANFNDGNTSVASMEQLVTGFTVGGQYQLSFEAEGLAGLNIYAGNPFYVSIDGVLVSFGGAGNTTVNPSGSYEFYVSDVFTATSSSMNLKFFDAGGQYFAQLAVIDNVAIVAVPEPASIALILSAAVMTAALWYRKRRK